MTSYLHLCDAYFLDNEGYVVKDAESEDCAWGLRNIVDVELYRHSNLSVKCLINLNESIYIKYLLHLLTSWKINKIEKNQLNSF